MVLLPYSRWFMFVWCIAGCRSDIEDFRNKSVSEMTDSVIYNISTKQSTHLLETQNASDYLRCQSCFDGVSKGRTVVGHYYEFYVNEYSYKFWAVFQMVTVFILLYSAFAAIYFAKYTFLTEVDNIKEDDLIFKRGDRRSFGRLDSTTFQRIMDIVQPT